MIRSVGMRIRFGAFELDEEKFRLTRDGVAVALRPKVFDLLHVLVRERERVVRREELFERLWSTTAVGFGSLSGLVNELRSALGESGRGSSSIRTVHARGYQFVAPVTELAAEAGAPEGGARSDRSSAPAADADAGAARAAEPGPSVERWRAMREGLGACGARAHVACLEAAPERSAWLAARMGEVIAAGFVPRFVSARGDGGRPARDPGCGVSRAEARSALAPAAPSLAAARSIRAPIALVLEIDDPEHWQRAGGLRRLLDLLGRAPVLVIAALAARGDEPFVPELIAGDPRIEWDGSGRPAARRAVEGTRPGDDDRAAALVEALQGLLHASAPHFVPALRSLGFEAIPAGPVRSPRRVEPGGRRAEHTRGAEAG